MHLMVLGASRQNWSVPRRTHDRSLNAPDGAGCFPTVITINLFVVYGLVSMHLMVLGASRPWSEELTRAGFTVSMHLMVLGASRRTALSSTPYAI